MRHTFDDLYHQEKYHDSLAKRLYRMLYTRKTLYLLICLSAILLFYYNQRLLKWNKDPFSTSTKCQKPFAPNFPLLTYGIMIDCGSTGSRIHVYKFNFCLSESPELEDEHFRQIKPGLSHYATEGYADYAQKAALSLDPLLKAAYDVIPAKMHTCTPILVKATAGLRLLKGDQADQILKAVENHLRRDWPFFLEADNPVSIMDGKDEAIFAWMTVNYLLKKFSAENKEKLPTAAIMDLGGGSTQIVFEPNFHDVSLNPEGLNPTCKVPPLTLNGQCGKFYEEKSISQQNYILYQHSYLGKPIIFIKGFGLMEARKLIKQTTLKNLLEHKNAPGISLSGMFIIDEKEHQEALLTEWIETSQTKDGITHSNINEILFISHPCLAPGHLELFKVQELNLESTKLDLSSKKFLALTGPLGKQPADFNQCFDLTKHIFEKNSCSYSPPHCSFNGIYQPYLDKTFTDLKGAQVYAFSYFYDRTIGILEDSIHFSAKDSDIADWKVEDFKHLAEIACSLDPKKVKSNIKQLKLSKNFWKGSLNDLETALISLISNKNPEKKSKVPELCMDLTFMYHLLYTGYGLSDQQPLKIKKKIDGIETGWCLGATIEMIQKHLSKKRICL